MSTESVSAVTTWVNAAPIMTATARSMTLPCVRKSLNPLNMVHSIELTYVHCPEAHLTSRPNLRSRARGQAQIHLRRPQNYGKFGSKIVHRNNEDATVHTENR